MEGAETLVFILEDEFAKLRLTLYYTAMQIVQLFQPLLRLVIYPIKLLSSTVLYQLCLMYLLEIMMW